MSKQIVYGVRIGKRWFSHRSQNTGNVHTAWCVAGAKTWLFESDIPPAIKKLGKVHPIKMFSIS